MANGVVKGKKLKRSLKDDNESRSVKRKTAHELQEIGDKRNDIGSFLINTAQGKLLLDILKVIAALVKKQQIWQYMSIVYYSTVLKQKFSGETLLENSRCRFCADAPSCPLQPQHITFTELPANRNSENVNEEEKNEVKAYKKAVGRDEKLWPFETSCYYTKKCQNNPRKHWNVGS
ncbi:hypothetical protein BOTNAR_0009g00030 [Botryotinia narcissicola]|uniref:Uncharacterized protein n=1 Tax=Botryotinia narcissicola TaxID=278944 RepID=A0A4Z1J7I3_9HELO|nr:hypothetical protein BOTNAR_0009g00030 [Botryotinia narcissicola]